MPDDSNRTTEPELSEVALQLMAERRDGRASFQDLIRLIPTRLALTAEDRQPSPTRPNEEIWEQRVRNIKSHDTAFGNIIAEGYAVSIAGGLEITPAGRLRVAR